MISFAASGKMTVKALPAYTAHQNRFRFPVLRAMRVQGLGLEIGQKILVKVFDLTM